MALQRWVNGAGVGYTWTLCFGAETTGIINGNAILSSIQIANQSPQDIVADFSASLASFTSGAGSPYVGLFLYPLNGDNTTFGDQQFSSSQAGPPSSAYWLCSIPIFPSLTTTAQTGTQWGLTIPPGTFKMVMYNQIGATMPVTSIWYRTYDFQVS